MKLALKIFGLLAAAIGLLLCVLFFYPRPPDTTESRVFASDGADVDYCRLPVLDGRGARADEIPKAYTPDCGWERWPMPVLAHCSEPLDEGVADLRGLWRSISPGFDHVERIEQCGNRSVVTAAGVIHDFITDGSVANGSRDIERPTCMNTWVSIEWEDGVMKFHPFGLPYTIVTRQREGDQLVWYYPVIGEVRMERICEVPESFRLRRRS